MARGKYLSLEEARKLGKLDRFCKEHPSVADRGRFERLLDAVTRGDPPVAERRKPRSSKATARTSPRARGAC